jgi:hypothetical protein
MKRIEVVQVIIKDLPHYEDFYVESELLNDINLEIYIKITIQLMILPR